MVKKGKQKIIIRGVPGDKVYCKECVCWKKVIFDDQVCTCLSTVIFDTKPYDYCQFGERKGSNETQN